MTVCPAWVMRGSEFEIELLCRREQRRVRAHLPQGVSCWIRFPSRWARAAIGSGSGRRSPWPTRSSPSLRLPPAARVVSSRWSPAPRNRTDAGGLRGRHDVQGDPRLPGRSAATLQRQPVGEHPGVPGLPCARAGARHRGLLQSPRPEHAGREPVRAALGQGAARHPGAAVQRLLLERVRRLSLGLRGDAGAAAQQHLRGAAHHAHRLRELHDLPEGTGGVGARGRSADAEPSPDQHLRHPRLRLRGGHGLDPEPVQQEPQHAAGGRRARRGARLPAPLGHLPGGGRPRGSRTALSPENVAPVVAAGLRGGARAGQRRGEPVSHAALPVYGRGDTSRGCASRS